MEIAYDITATTERRETATGNILVLAREKSGKSFTISAISKDQFYQSILFFSLTGGELLMKEHIYEKISSMLKLEKNSNIIINSIRTISALCKDNIERVGVNHCY